jgi:hypothetical protein
MAAPPLSLRLLPTLLAAVALSAIAATAGAQQVGVNSAVNPDATGTPPSAATRKLVIGQEVLHNEKIATGPVGQTQILFLDESAMTVGPNADVTIDEFVYDPHTGKGRLAMSATQGVMRFVGGKLSKNEDAVTMRTPSGSLGIRGGIFVMSLKGGILDAIFLHGHGLDVTNAGVKQTITRESYGVTVASPTSTPSKPAFAGDKLAGILDQFSGHTGSTGGAKNPPTDASVVAAGIPAVISGNVGVSVQQAQQFLQQPQLQVVNPSTIQSSAQLSSVSTQVATEVQNSSPPPSPAVIQIGGTIKSTNSTSGATNAGFVDQSPQGRIPYSGIITFPAATPNANGIGTATVNGVTFTIGPLTPGQTTNVTATASDARNGASGTATFTSDGTFFFADLVANGPQADRIFIYGGIPVSQSFFTTTTPTSQFLSFTLFPDAALANGASPQTIPFLPSNFGGTSANANVSPLLVVTPTNTPFGSGNNVTNPNVQAPRTLQASLALNGAGAGQTSALVIATGAFFTSSDTGKVTEFNLINGAVLNSATGPLTHIISGSAAVPDGNGNNLFGGNSITGFVIDQNSFNTTDNFKLQLATANTAQPGTNIFNYAFNQPAIASTVPSGIGTSRTSQNQMLFTGGLMQFGGFGGNPSTYALLGAGALQTDATNNRLQATFAAVDPFTPNQSGIHSMSLAFGSLSGGNFARSTFIDDTHFGAGESPSTPSQVNGTNLPTLVQTNSDATTPQLGLVSGAVVNNVAPGFPGGTTLCSCQFLQWGYWTGSVPVPGLGQGGGTRTDFANINTWVAGVPTVTLPASGVGTFNGAAIATINNNGANYLASGGFNSVYNFGNNSGSFAINNLDGRSYTGGVSGSGRSPIFAGSFGGVAPNNNLSGVAAGSLYGPNATEIGGTFGINNSGGTPYLAAGVFAGNR